MSFFHTCNLTMAIRSELRASSMPRLLRALRPAFAVRDLSYRLAANEMKDLLFLAAAAPDAPELWRGEFVDADTSLTGYRLTDDDDELLTAFDAQLKRCDETTFWMSATGALRHRRPGATAAEWFGRWLSADGALHELVTVRIACKPGEPRELEVIFPLAGYPLTASRLGNNSILPGDPSTALLNRDELLPIIGAARAALGLGPAEAHWSLDAEFSSDFPEDAAALRVWIDRVNR